MLRASHGLAAFATALAMQFAVMSALVFALGVNRGHPERWAWWWSLGPWIVGLALAAVVFLACKFQGLSVRKTVFLERASARDVTLSLGAILAVAPWTSLLRQLLTGEPYTPSTSSLDGTPAVVRLLAIVLVGPIAEEMFYRGYLLRAFSRRSVLVGVAATSMVFAVTHPGFPASLVIHCPFAIVTAFSVLVSRSLYGAIAGHIATNVGVFFGVPAALDLRGPWAVAGSLLVLGPCLGLLWVRRAAPAAVAMSEDVRLGCRDADGNDLGSRG